MSTSGSARPAAPTLRAALDALAEVAEQAGVPAGAALAEGAAFAAAIAESAVGASADWVRAVGGGATVQDFFDAASRARRWRAAPTATLGALVAAGSPMASAYANALAQVASSACGLGEPSVRVIGNASVAAAAQLGAVGAQPQATGQLPGGLAALNPATAGAGAVPGLPGDLLSPESVLSVLNALNAGVSGAVSPGASLTVLPNQPMPYQPLPGQPVPHPLPQDGGVATRQAGLADQQAAKAEATQAAPARTVEELLAELDGLVGLKRVKREVHRQVALLRVEKLRSDAGLKSASMTRHLVFTGNPGTGKTTVARLVGGIYQALGLLSGGHLVEVDRSELVAGYLGQTAPKTAEVVASATGGVLFIDEAYSLTGTGPGGDQYGQESVDTLVKEMEDRRDDLVVIVAGYPAPMAVFIAANPGLASRFRTTIEFEDYTDDELVEILQHLAQGADYELEPAAEQRFREVLGRTPRGESFGNGRYARNALEAAIGHQAWRLRETAAPTLEQLRLLVARDFDEEPLDEGAEPGPAASDRDPAPAASLPGARIPDPGGTP